VPRNREAGLAFISVLVTVSIGAGLVLGMVSRQDATLGAASDHIAFAEARSVAEGALLAVEMAFSADASTAPEVDHWGEAWFQARQDQIAIHGGTLSVEVEDLGGKIDVNSSLEPPQIKLFARALSEVGLNPGYAAEIAAHISDAGPVTSLVGLVPDRDRKALGLIAAALPQPHPLNLNTAPEPVINALFPQRGVARRVLAVREETGQITAADLTQLGVLRPPSTGFTTHHIKAVAVAERDGVSVRCSVHFQRDEDAPHLIRRPHQSLEGQ
jgi:type II secretory pathway component PulK